MAVSCHKVGQCFLVLLMFHPYTVFVSSLYHQCFIIVPIFSFYIIVNHHYLMIVVIIITSLLYHQCFIRFLVPQMFHPCTINVSSLYCQCFILVLTMFHPCSVNVSSLYYECILIVSSMFPHCTINVSSCTVNVSLIYNHYFYTVPGLPDDASEEGLSMFFEVERYSGGGPIEPPILRIQDEKKAVITFKEAAGLIIIACYIVFTLLAQLDFCFRVSFSDFFVAVWDSQIQ